MKQSLMVSLLMAATMATAGQAWAETTAKRSRFVAHGDTVYDRQTNLTWQRCSVGQQWRENAGCTGMIRVFTFDAAQDQAARNPWRVPTKDELASLVDMSKPDTSPKIDEEAFPGMDIDHHAHYWSSTSANVWDKWFVRFDKGYVGYYGSFSRVAVRLVRSGK